MKDELLKVLYGEQTFEEAKAYFGDKLILTKEEYKALQEKYKRLAFTVSGYSELGIINQFYNEVLKAIDEGTTYEVFKSNMNTFLKDKGYDVLSDFQLDNIFRTNIQTAYNAGHYEHMTAKEVIKERPYWRYEAVDDEDTRPEHRAMDGLVFRADDPIWDTWYPPNGYRCRCTVTSLSERQLISRGLKVQQNEVPFKPDEGFHINPAKKSFKPDIKDYPTALKKVFEKRMKQGSK